MARNEIAGIREFAADCQLAGALINSAQWETLEALAPLGKVRFIERGDTSLEYSYALTIQYDDTPGLSFLRVDLEVDGSLTPHQSR